MKTNCKKFYTQIQKNRFLVSVMSFLDQIKNRNSKLNQVQTRVTRADGKVYIESYGNETKRAENDEENSGEFFVVDTRPDEEVHQVIPGLFIGCQDAATNFQEVTRNKISSILNVAVGVMPTKIENIKHKSMPLYDEPRFDIRAHFEEGVDFLREQLASGSVLVHCNAGISRSTTIIVAFLMKEKKMGLNEALELVRVARPIAKPNPGFMKQLRTYEKDLIDGTA